MLNLEIKDVKEAIQTLHSKLKTMDIQHYENSRGVKKSVVTESNENSRKITVEKCANCKFSSKPETSQLHRIMKCFDIHFCYRCGLDHLALGPHCKFKDKKIFDFDAFFGEEKG